VDSGTWDYVIVGAGSAGCVLANRLCADPSVRVLLIEAGPRDGNPWIHVPGGIFKLIHNPAVDWCFTTEPDPGVAGRSLQWPRGKVLGGSSSINGLVYIRGQREDFDGWRDLGNEGWSYDDVLPCFRRSERQARGADPFHGTEGSLVVSDPAMRMEIVDAFVAAAGQAGIPSTADFNGARQEGAGYFQLTVDRGRRCSAAVAFLRPVAGRANLTVVTGARVERVLIDGNRAAGVQFRRGGRVGTARASRETILSAGAINTPHLLMLSGIGDPDALGRAGVAVRHALPAVGKNLQDHIQARVVFRARRPITLNDQARTLPRRAMIGARYLMSRTGPLSFAASLAGAFARTRPSLDRPDVQFHFQPLSLDSYDGRLHGFSGFTISVCQLRPDSRGAIVLRSDDPATPPRIEANYLHEPGDGATMVEGMRLLRRIAAAPALAAQIAEEYRPGPDVSSDEAVLAYVRATGSSIFHPAGTCRMGPGADCVVDPQLRVHGLDGLRVADCSIMPTLVSGNTNAAAIMIGEKAAELILGRPAATSDRSEPGRPCETNCATVP
jgi:choline dehydrogenase